MGEITTDRFDIGNVRVVNEDGWWGVSDREGWESVNVLNEVNGDISEV